MVDTTVAKELILWPSINDAGCDDNNANRLTV